MLTISECFKLSFGSPSLTIRFSFVVDIEAKSGVKKKRRRKKLYTKMDCRKIFSKFSDMISVSGYLPVQWNVTTNQQKCYMIQKSISFLSASKRHREKKIEEEKRCCKGNSLYAIVNCRINQFLSLCFLFSLHILSRLSHLKLL